jgi:formate-dependent nitrite reductase membrane component NrfD
MFGLAIAFFNPTLLLQCFIMGATVLYAWHANRFFLKVVIGRQSLTKKQKDWLQVNAIVAFIFSILGIVNLIFIISNPQLIEQALKQLPPTDFSAKDLMIKISYVFCFFCAILLVHVVWTYMLIKKYKAYFKN